MWYFYKNNIFKHNIIEESMNKQKTKDLNLGGFCEQEFLKLYGKRYNKLKNQFSIIDFKHKKKKIIVELKARRYAFDGGIGDGAWQIGKNKIQKGKQLLNKGYTFYIYMVFLDGLYYYKYDPETFEDDLYIAVGGRVDRDKNEEKDYYYIKKEKFKKAKHQFCVPKKESRNKLYGITECLID